MGLKLVGEIAVPDCIRFDLEHEGTLFFTNLVDGREQFGQPLLDRSFRDICERETERELPEQDLCASVVCLDPARSPTER